MNYWERNHLLCTETRRFGSGSDHVGWTGAQVFQKVFERFGYLEEIARLYAEFGIKKDVGE